MKELKEATGVNLTKIGEAATAICEEIGVETTGTLKEKAHRAAAELSIPITYEAVVASARVKATTNR